MHKIRTTPCLPSHSAQKSPRQAKANMTKDNEFEFHPPSLFQIEYLVSCIYVLHLHFEPREFLCEGTCQIIKYILKFQPST